MADSHSRTINVTTIEPKSGWQLINIKELKEYRDLFYFLVWRDIKVLYAQTILGFMWALLLPLIQIVIFTVIFGKVAKVSTDGIPYFLYATVGIIPWNYMAQSMTGSSQSLVSNQRMLGKVYFPRLIFPMTPILSKLVDFGISIFIVIFVMLYYHTKLTWNIFFLPIFVLLMVMVSGGIGMWLSAMAIRFRDIRHAMPFVVRMLMYSAPIVYSVSSVSLKYRAVYSLNPIVSVIEGFKFCLLGLDIDWICIWPGAIVAVLLFVSGMFYFKSMERIFVDVI